jgi:dCTP deaminase
VSGLPAQSIRASRPLAPLCERTRLHGVTYGLGPAGYDIRISEDRWVWPGRFFLASGIEYFMMPGDLRGVVHDKSTWIRCSLAVHNTVIEPGWQGHLTLELKKNGWRRPKRTWAPDPEAPLPWWHVASLHVGYFVLNLWPVFKVRAGSGIAQVLFDRLEEPTDVPYEGKYQGQRSGPVEAIFEATHEAPAQARAASAAQGGGAAVERISWGRGAAA